MADGIIQIPADSTGKKLDTTELTVGANLVERERMVIGGDASTELADVKNTTPSTGAFGLVVRQTGVVVLSSQISGSTYLDSANEAIRVNVVTGGGSLTASSSQTFPTQLSTAPNTAYIDPRQVTVVGGTSGAYISVLNATAQGAATIDPRQSTIVAATSGAVLWTVGAGSSGVTGTSLISTGLTGAAIDPRQATIVAGTSGAGLGTILSTAVGSAAIDPRLVTLQAGTTALVGAIAFATVSNNVSLWSSSGVNISASTVAPTSDGMGMFVRLVNASSSLTNGNIMVSTGFNTAAIDVRQATIVAGTSGAGLGTILSTGAGGAAIDARQATIVAATSGAGLGTIISTGAGGASIDPRARTWNLSTSDVTAISGAASSGMLGSVMITTAVGTTAIDPRAATLSVSSSQTFPIQLSTAPNTAYIDPRQATIIAATSGTGLGVILSTGAGGAAIDARARTWNLSTSDITGAILLSSGQGFVMASTVVPATDAMALIARLTSSSSGQTIGNVTVSTGTVALYSSTGGAIAVSTQTLSTDAMGFAVRVAAAASSNNIGAVFISTAAGGLRGYLDSTSPNQLYFWTTGIAAAAAATMQSLNRTTNLSSGSSGTSFNVASGRIFRIDNVNGSIRLTSGTDLYADFAIRAVTTTGGATGTNFPVFYYRLASAVAASTNALAVGGGGSNFSMTGLSIDLPSSASFGVSIVSNSTASQECTFAFGGKEYLI